MLSLIDSIAGLEEIAEEWRSLWRDCPSATPFQSPEWILAWLHHIFEGGQICTVSLRKEGKLAGLLPLFRWGPYHLNLSLIGTGITDYNDVLLAEGTLCPSLTDPTLQVLLGDWQKADFEDLRPGSPLCQIGIRDLCSVCPVIDLPGTMDELTATLDAKFRTDTRRAGNRLLRAGEIAIDRSTDLEQLFRLHRARWREKNEEGVLGGDRLKLFHQEVAAGFEKLGILRLYTLRIDTACVAVVYAFQHRQRCYGYLNGFDPHFAKLSPGNVLLAHVIEQAIQERATQFDFLRGAEPYKYLWTARDTPTYRVTIERNATASR